MTWEEDLEEKKKRADYAKEMGGIERIAKHYTQGRLTVRERIDLLLDEGSFHETGEITGKVSYDEDGNLKDFIPSNFIFGRGTVKGKKVVVAGDDFTVRGGAADARIGNKFLYSLKLAEHLRIPLVNLVDGSGGGGSVKTLETMGATYVPGLPGWQNIVRLLSMVPVVGACMGSVAGLGSARVVASHFSIMVKETSQMFVAGPPVVERAFGLKMEREELGGSKIHTSTSGAVDNEASSEEDAFEQIQTFLSFLPPNVWESPPRKETDDPIDRKEEDLVSIIPKDRKAPYEIRDILSLVLDKESFFEIGSGHGKSLVTGLARLSGYSVGILANDCNFDGGAVTAQASEKMTRFIDVCDTFNIPVVNFVDNPGFLIGLQAEESGVIRYGVRALYAVWQASIPWVSIIVRRVFGVAGGGHGNSDSLNLRYAWPSGDWGSLPIEGGVMAAYKRDIESSSDPKARQKEIEQSLDRVRSPYRTAEMFGIEEIIDPRDTRPLLCDWVDSVYKNLHQDLGIKKRTIRP
ncbi:MAG: carboxyl transferase domain-containing protein [Pseudomonadota bacterium]|nr:carboxyl transferase domain-containing protein [Pseudomonadota bacterium]|tara:strand:+ start:485 stop:2044 length:1560 start_codon:yes stop_codon:yes gene_type:complete